MVISTTGSVMLKVVITKDSQKLFRSQYAVISHQNNISVSMVLLGMSDNLTYAEILARAKEREAKPDNSFTRNSAPANSKPKKSGRGDTYRHDFWENQNKVRIVKSVFTILENSSQKKYYACVRCGAFVSLPLRRKQRDKFVVGKGYEGLLCKAHCPIIT